MLGGPVIQKEFTRDGVWCDEILMYRHGLRMRVNWPEDEGLYLSAFEG